MTGDSEFLTKLLKERYCIGNEYTWEHICERVSSYIADSQDEKNEFYSMMMNKEFIPNSPTLMNAGTETPMLSACFYLPISDCISNGRDGIFDQVKNSAMIFKYGGGVGLNFSNLRPAGSKVKSTNGVSSGVISFMKNFNTMTETIKQGGKRRGALMGCLDINHPEIKDFVTCKHTEGELSNFNISVKLTDEFIEKVIKNSEKETEIFNLIINGIYKNGEPGILFKDEVERHNTRPELGELNQNPCLHKNTYIFTQNGLERISSSPPFIFDGGGFIKSKIWCNNIKETIKITTNSGYEYITTPDHMFMLSDNNWCEAKDLYNKNIKFELSDKQWIGNNPYPEMNYEITGFMFGDASYHDASKRVKYIYLTPEKDDEVEKIISDEFEVRTYMSGVRKIINVPIEKILYTQLFTDITLHRMIPEWILTLPKYEMGLFIRGLFSANGTNLKDYNKIQLVSVNKKMLQQVQQMLLLFGIKGKLWVHNKEHDVLFNNGNYTCKESYHIVISSKSYTKYLDEIGFIQTYKNGYTAKRPSDERLFETIISIEEYENSEVWDFESKYTHYSIINGAYVHNCAEAMLYDFESCNLGSINLAALYHSGIDSVSGKWEDHINWTKYEALIRNGVIFLNRVIDKNKYPLPEIDKASKLTRKIGLGVMGFHDLLLKLNIPYDSPMALEIAKELETYLKKVALNESEKYKFENVSLTTVAPTGTISIIANVSSGIEPVFNWVITRKDSLGEHYIIHPIFDTTLKQLIFDFRDYDIKFESEQEAYDYVLQHCHEKGTIQDIAWLPKQFKLLFKNAMDIGWEQHIKMQATFQTNGVDMSISKTINMPNNATKDDIKSAIIMAWKMKCKGLTIYRNGSRENEVLNLKKPDVDDIDWIDVDAEDHFYEKKIPAWIYKVKSGCGKFYTIIGHDHELPVTVFVEGDGVGGCVGNMAGLGRSLSAGLEWGTPPEHYVKQFSRVKCMVAMNSKDAAGKSCSDIIGKCLKDALETLTKTKIVKIVEEHIDEHINLLCPKCNQKLSHESGCVTCNSCGYSKCN